MSGGRPRRPRRARPRSSTPGDRLAWGWHQLDAEWARRVVDASPVSSGDLVVDLGAGNGGLTEPLLLRRARVVAVEVNEARAALLRRRFQSSDVTVVQVDLRRLRLPRQHFRVVASPPYALSTEMVRLLLSNDAMLSADLVLQRAAARRILLSPPSGRHARLFRLSVGMAIPRRAFSPPPRVESVVLKIRRGGSRRTG